MQISRLLPQNVTTAINKKGLVPTCGIINPETGHLVITFGQSKVNGSPSTEINNVYDSNGNYIVSVAVDRNPKGELADLSIAGTSNKD